MLIFDVPSIYLSEILKKKIFFPGEKYVFSIYTASMLTFQLYFFWFSIFLGVYIVSCFFWKCWFYMFPQFTLVKFSKKYISRGKNMYVQYIPLAYWKKFTRVEMRKLNSLVYINIWKKWCPFLFLACFDTHICLLLELVSY